MNDVMRREAHRVGKSEPVYIDKVGQVPNENLALYMFWTKVHSGYDQGEAFSSVRRGH